jgi:prevent-host-death family protein
MRIISDSEAKQSLGLIINVAQKEPVIIQRQHRDVAVLLSMHDYEQLQGARVEAFQALCDKISQRAQKRGLTKEKFKALLGDDFQE